MKRLLSILSLIALLALLPACSVSEEAVVDTDFERMLGYVPASALKEFDICFIDQKRAKQLYGLEDITNMKQVINIPEERREAVMGFGWDTDFHWPSWRIYELTPVIGFDGMLFDRLILTVGTPPDCFTIAEADFDEDLITGLLTDRGYTEAEYGSYSYYGIREDYSHDLRDPLSQYVLGAMNRMAVHDNRIIFAPATHYITDIFDTMSCNITSILDTPASRALADSLGDVITAVIIPTERVLLDWHEQTVPAYYFDIPADWGLLHEYELVAMSYRVEDEQQYWDIALYYLDEDDAEADSTELSTRMNSYLFRTQHQGLDYFPLTDYYEVGEPQVQKYSDGAVLKISCRHIPESRIGGSYGMGSIDRPRDVLFLATDPSLYTK